VTAACSKPDSRTRRKRLWWRLRVWLPMITVSSSLETGQWATSIRITWQMSRDHLSLVAPMIVPIISLISSTVARSARHNVLFNVLVRARRHEYILTANIIHEHILYNSGHQTRFLKGRCLILQQYVQYCCRIRQRPSRSWLYSELWKFESVKNCK